MFTMLSAMNDKCLYSLFTLLHNVRMARLTQANPATKGPRLLSHQENIHCAQPRDPQTRSNPRCCSLELLSAEQFQAKSCCTWALGLDLVHNVTKARNADAA